jgi:hypothetical protein
MSAKLMLGLLALGILSSCASVTLYPIKDSDIIRVEKDRVYTFKESGYYMTDFYLKEVVNAKVKK